MKRPFTNHYFLSQHDKPDEWASHGHAATEEGAIRSCVPRIFMQQYAMVRVYDRGVLAYTVHHTARGMAISYGDAPLTKRKPLQ